MGLYRNYFGMFRALMAPIQKHIQGNSIAFRFNKNAAVGLIQRKAFNTQLVGHRFGGCAVKYALHVTGNGNIEVFIQWLIGLNELIKLSVKNKTIQLNQPNLT